MEILKPEELKEKFSDPWIAPYEKVITMVDGDSVELIEYHPCPSGSHWLLYQYQHSSELIMSARRDGNKHVYMCKTGRKPIDLKASINAAGIEEIVVDDEKNEVKVTHGGLAGAGVGAGMCRGMGEGVKYVHNIGSQLKDEGFEYLDHIICQLYPHNPHKTQNCVSIALTFAVLEEDKERLIERLIEILKHDTLSDKTAIAILEGIGIPEKLREYAMATKTGMMDVETAEKVAEDLDIPLIAVTGDQGKVGALAALGLYDDCDEAVKVYY